MTNKILFIANWKMFGDLNSVKSIKSVINLSKKKKYKKAKIIYCPPYTLLDKFVIKTRKTKLCVGAQNCHQVINTGPYTGAISTTMIKKIGAKYVIIGHSENRSNGETNNQINKKIHSAISNNLNVIFCIGENLFEKKHNRTNNILKKQIYLGLKQIKKIDKIIFAYEPVWSIGTGKILTNKELTKQIIIIKNIIKNLFKKQKTKIIYGGSVNNKNINNLKQINEIDGFLIGGASQNSKKFIDIIKKTIN
ncbi:triose-phosphate isomerase [Candidatus Pelagibacter sp.]|nr:triose-phosphate isomerase [Candidatus Pelagibacter sp.]